MKKDVSFILGLSMVIFVVLLFMLSFTSLADKAEVMNLSRTFEGPSKDHLLGTDQFGRDTLARISLSTRYVFMVSFGSVSIGALIGILLGCIAGIGPRFVENLIMRIMDGMLAFPGILLALMLVFVLGKGIRNSLIAIAVFMVPVFCRLSYSMILERKNLLYIKAARSYGMGSFAIVWHHLLPQMLPRLLTQFTSGISRTILTEGSLSFLGLGIQPPSASLGLMLSEARQYYLSHPYLGIAPGIVLMIAILGFNLLGDYFNDLWIGGVNEDD